jgi:hypothetical protein
MIEHFLHRPWGVAQLRASVCGPDLDALTDELQRIGCGGAANEVIMRSQAGCTGEVRSGRRGWESMSVFDKSVEHTFGWDLCKPPRSPIIRRLPRQGVAREPDAGTYGLYFTRIYFDPTEVRETVWP